MNKRQRNRARILAEEKKARAAEKMTWSRIKKQAKKRQIELGQNEAQRLADVRANETEKRKIEKKKSAKERKKALKEQRKEKKDGKAEPPIAAKPALEETESAPEAVEDRSQKAVSETQNAVPASAETDGQRARKSRRNRARIDRRRQLREQKRKARASEADADVPQGSEIGNGNSKKHAPSPVINAPGAL